MKVRQDIAGSILIQLTRHLQRLRIDPDGLLRDCGLDPAMLRDPDARISAEDFVRVEEKAVEASGDPYFGLHAGESFELGHYGIVGYLMANCEHLDEAMSKGDKYGALLGGAVSTKVQLTLRSVRIVYSRSPIAPPLSFHCYDSMMVSLVTLVRKLTGMSLNPLKVSLVREAPSDTGEYRRIYGCPVSFGQRHNYLEVDNRIGRTAIIHPNNMLAKSFEAIAQESLDAFESSAVFTNMASRCIVENMFAPNLGISLVAKALGVGTRTLQSRLAGEGTNFRELLRETRIKVAKNQIKRGQTISETAYLLGYSELSAFSNAFKEWTGYTPREYRNCACDSSEGA